MLKRLLLMVFLAGLCGAAWGQDFGLDLGCCSQPFNGSVTLTTTGGGVFGFENDFETPITQLLFETTVKVGLGANYFDKKCESGFFQTCQDIYNNDTGDLQILFNTNFTGPDIGETTCDDEANEGEGIPSALGCPSPTGHFLITLNDGFLDTGSAGSWGGVIPNNESSLSIGVVQINNVNVPEPSSLGVLGLGGLFLVAGFVRRRVTRRA
jgi:PEP-CTERM motif-containing protein